MQWDLSNVSLHLSKFDWKGGLNSDKNSADYNTYLKACELANKALYSRNETALFEKVAVQTVSQNVIREFYLSQEGDKAEICEMPQSQDLPINPEMQVRHLEALLKKQNQARKVVINGLNSNDKITSESLANARISIPVEPRWFRCFDSWGRQSSEMIGMDELD